MRIGSNNSKKNMELLAFSRNKIYISGDTLGLKLSFFSYSKYKEAPQFKAGLIYR